MQVNKLLSSFNAVMTIFFGCFKLKSLKFTTLIVFHTAVVLIKFVLSCVLFRVDKTDHRHCCCARCNSEFSAGRNADECEFTRCGSRDVQTNQACLSPKGAVLCHKTGTLHYVIT